jgi:hypothetical protein
MPVDFDAVLKEMNAQEASLQSELDTLRAGRAAILRLKKGQEIRSALSPNAPRFAGMGAKKAVLDVLKDASGTPMTTPEIYDQMVAGGWTTDSERPQANVSATLSQMKDKEVVKVGEAWRLKNLYDSIIEMDSTSSQRPS